MLGNQWSTGVTMNHLEVSSRPITASELVHQVLEQCNVKGRRSYITWDIVNRDLWVNLEHTDGSKVLRVGRRRHCAWPVLNQKLREGSISRYSARSSQAADFPEDSGDVVYRLCHTTSISFRPG